MFLNSSTGLDIPIAELARLVCHAFPARDQPRRAARRHAALAAQYPARGNIPFTKRLTNFQAVYDCETQRRFS
ncbi:hypothetical protein P0R31_05175 [Bradyrhizobium yuanmingense]|uniref:hypothetical protein n=1 Tax=Bradyrhizobium yuanmingense TaxID=108015 RepID=UPI0023B9EC87|nr:hypothetical protein [Bradyrhizobium yuanmingense]MDF0516631.1 hypothetical protein [Bradyrhizobium yuanmingense]